MLLMQAVGTASVNRAFPQSATEVKDDGESRVGEETLIVSAHSQREAGGARVLGPRSARLVNQAPTARPTRIEGNSIR